MCFLLRTFRKMESWTQRLNKIGRKFAEVYENDPRFDLLGKGSDELSEIEKASFRPEFFVDSRLI